MSHREDCRTLGQHVGTRLVEAGVQKFFGVPGDYNLQLLDELVKEDKLEAVWCSNELNAGYAADGYARVKGVGCVVVTYNVGGLSAINAVAGAYAENLPVICITGGPNSNDAGNVDYGTGRIVHHTIADPDGFMQEVECYKHVTCEQVVIRNLDNAHELIDRAISAALVNSKPVYISIACNLAGLGHPSFVRPPIPYSCWAALRRAAQRIWPSQAAAGGPPGMPLRGCCCCCCWHHGESSLRCNEVGLQPSVCLLRCNLARKPSNPQSLAAAVDAALAFLGGKKKPVVVAGALLRMSHAQKQFMHFVEASGYPYAPMPAAKGFVPEGHPQYMGTYWGQVSSPSVGEVVESADAYLFAGPVFSDYSTVGYSLNLSPAKMVKVDPYRVTVAGGKGGQVYGCVRMDDFLEALAAKVQRNGTALEIFSRLHQPPAEVPASADGSPLETKVLFKHVQGLLDSNSILLAETGDSIFNCQKLRLPEGATYEWAQQYGSIGWSVGATLGAAVAAGAVGRRVVACIGDGSFQMTAQAVSDMLRARANPVIMLINNAGYTIEVEIHDGPYNVIKNWDYVKFVEAVHNGDGELFACRVRTEAELVDALAKVKGEAAQKLCFIECIIDKDDCSKELLEFGALVSDHNSKPPVYN